jgi:branched-chain amino acid transport system substrate-binding protein
MYERLAVVNRVHVMLGPYSSPLTLAASPAAERHHIPFVAVCANSPRIYSRGYQWLVCVIDKAPGYTGRYWDMIKAEAKAKTVFFVVEDTLHPQGVFQGAERLARGAGLSVSGHRSAPRDQRDFSSILVNLKKVDPDIVFVSSNIPFAVQFMIQAREMGLSPREFHVIHHGGVFRRALGRAAEGITGQSYWTPGMGFSDPERFMGLLDKAGFSLEDYPWAPAYMMAFEVVEAAVKKAGTTDTGKIMQTLKGLKMETLGGMVCFGPDGAGSINTYPSQIQKGRYQVVWPRQVATAPHVYPANP